MKLKNEQIAKIKKIWNWKAENEKLETTDDVYNFLFRHVLLIGYEEKKKTINYLLKENTDIDNIIINK